MDYPHGGASQIWRDDENPIKSEIRDWGGAVEQKADDAEAGLLQVQSLKMSGDDIVSQYDAPAPNLPCAIIQRATQVELYSPLSIPGFWNLDILKANTAAMMRPAERRIVQYADLYHEIFDGFTTSGTFSRIGNSSAWGGAYRYASTVGAYVEKQITLTAPSTVVRVGFAKRNTANHISVTIDGSTDLVGLLPVNGAGERYIDAYDAATTPVVNCEAAVATLPAGTYTIRMTNSAEKNASAAAGNRFYPQAILFTGGAAGLPGGAKTHAPTWVDGETVTSSDQRWWAGITYRATVSGTTSGTSPLDDTGVTWATVADTYALMNEPYLLDVSEPTWAIWLALNGQPEEDFGGDIHGGVTLVDTIISVDGNVVTLQDDLPVYAVDIEVKQTATLAHTAAPATPVADAVMTYGCRPGGDFPYLNRLIPRFAGLRGLYYCGMLPLYHYLVDGSVYLARRCLLQFGGSARPSDYYGTANPQFGPGNSLQQLALVEIASPEGAGGGPASDKEGPFFAAVSLEMTRDSMENFEGPGAGTSWDMNTSGVDVSGGGYTGMTVKGYFRVSDGTTKKAVSAGDVIEARGVYRVRLHRGSAGNP